MPNSLYRMPLIYLSLACVFCYSCSFLFVVFCVFVFFFCSHWSLVDVPLISFCPADHVQDWQPRILLGMVEARSVNVKKTTTTTTREASQQGLVPRGVKYTTYSTTMKRRLWQSIWKMKRIQYFVWGTTSLQLLTVLILVLPVTDHSPLTINNNVRS